MRYLSILVAVLLVCGCDKESQSGQRATAVDPTGGRPHDILEIYHGLPADYFYCEAKQEMDREERARLIVRQDRENDYILATVEHYPMEVKSFEDENGELAFVAVIVSCGPNCSCEKMEFLRPDDSAHWVEAHVKMSVAKMTEAYEARVAEARGRELYPRFKLPEQGTTIRVQDWETELPIYDLRWTGAALEVLAHEGGIPEDW